MDTQSQMNDNASSSGAAARGVRWGRLAGIATLAVMLFAAAPASASVITIGTFEWEAVDPVFPICNGIDPCVSLKVTNLIATLDATERAEVGLAGNESFEDAEILENSYPFGLIAVGGTGVFLGDFMFSTATLALKLPQPIIGTLQLPILTGPGIRSIRVNTGPSVPEPSLLSIVALAAGAACARRRSHHCPGSLTTTG